MKQYKIERLGYQGDGICEGPVYAPRTLPGEVVSGNIDGQTLTHIKIVTPSDHRVKAPCRHYNSCGGCSLQHASDDFVKNWKIGIVKTALLARGIEVEPSQVHTSGKNTRRRAKLSGRRTKSGAVVGFHGRASDTVVATPDCTVLSLDILRAIPLLERITELVGSRKGEIQFQVTMTLNGLDLQVLGARSLSPVEQAEFAQIVRPYGVARLTWDDTLIAGENPAAVQMGNASVVPPPGAFLQATVDGQEALTQFVMQHAQGAKRIIDLFAGCGTFSLPLAAIAPVHAVEGEASMISALNMGWRQSTSLKDITSEVRDLFRRPLMKDELAKFDLAVIDPPRAGAEAQISHLIESKCQKIISISCNPVTFARDAEQLILAGYAIETLDVVDQFRWSSHIEIAAVFLR